MTRARRCLREANLRPARLQLQDIKVRSARGTFTHDLAFASADGYRKILATV